MSEIQLINAARAPLLAQPYFAKGDPGPIVGALAHVPELLEVTMPFVSAALGPSSIDQRTKEFVILRTSALMECRFCTQTHAAVALEAGIPTDQVRALVSTRGAADSFDDAAERALVCWVEAVVGRAGDTGRASRLSEHFEEHEIVELVLLAGATVMLNIFCTALDLPTGAEALARIEAEGLA